MRESFALTVMLGRPSLYTVRRRYAIIRPVVPPGIPSPRRLGGLRNRSGAPAASANDRSSSGTDDAVGAYSGNADALSGLDGHAFPDRVVGLPVDHYGPAGQHRGLGHACPAHQRLQFAVPRRFRETPRRRWRVAPARSHGLSGMRGHHLTPAAIKAGTTTMVVTSINNPMCEPTMKATTIEATINNADNTPITPPEGTKASRRQADRVRPVAAARPRSVRS